MKQKTKRIIINSISIIIIILELFIAYMYGSGMIEVEEIQIEGVDIPTLSSTAQVVVLCILAGIHFVIIILTKQLAKHKKALITLEAIQALLGGLPNIIAVAVCVPILCVKTTDEEEQPKKLELPTLEEVNSMPRWAYFVVWTVIFVLAYAGVLNLAIQNLNETLQVLIALAFYIGQVVALTVCMRKEIARDFKAFCKNFKTYMSYIFSKFGLFVLAYIVVAVVLVLIIGDMSTNQQTLNELPITVMAVMAIVWAPWVEELMFRGFLKKILGNNKWFLIVSSLVFGLLHVTFAEENWLNYLYIIQYSMIGFFLAKIYSKTDNLFTNMFVHCMWNTMCVVITALVQIGG